MAEVSHRCLLTVLRPFGGQGSTFSSSCIIVRLGGGGLVLKCLVPRWDCLSHEVAIRGVTWTFTGTSHLMRRQTHATCGCRYRAQQQEDSAFHSCQKKKPMWALTCTGSGQEQARRTERGKDNQEIRRAWGFSQNQEPLLELVSEKRNMKCFTKDKAPGMLLITTRWGPYGKHLGQLVSEVLLRH